MMNEPKNTAPFRVLGGSLIVMAVFVELSLVGSRRYASCLRPFGREVYDCNQDLFFQMTIMALGFLIIGNGLATGVSRYRATLVRFLSSSVGVVILFIPVYIYLRGVRETWNQWRGWWFFWIIGYVLIAVSRRWPGNAIPEAERVVKTRIYLLRTFATILTLVCLCLIFVVFPYFEGPTTSEFYGGEIDPNIFELEGVITYEDNSPAPSLGRSAEITSNDQYEVQTGHNPGATEYAQVPDIIQLITLGWALLDVLVLIPLALILPVPPLPPEEEEDEEGLDEKEDELTPKIRVFEA